MQMWQIVAAVCCENKKYLHSLMKIFNKRTTVLVTCLIGI